METVPSPDAVSNQAPQGDGFVERDASQEGVTVPDDDASSASDSQPKKKKVKTEEAAPPNHGAAFASIAGDPNLLALGSGAFNSNFSLAFNTGLPMAGLVANQPFLANQPMSMASGFPGTSPGYGPAGMGHNPLYGYGQGLAMAPAPAAAATGAGRESPDGSNGNDGAGEGGDAAAARRRRSSSLSGMTPLVFAPTAMPVNHHAMVARAPVPAASFHPLMHVVSTDPQVDNGGAVRPVMMMPVGNVGELEQPKRWVRWSDNEDNILRTSVAHLGENNFRHISENIFRGTRSESQCKNRWKKALQPGLVRGQWSKEEDDIIHESVAQNLKWTDIANHLPGRLGEQIKDRWVNVLDPEIKRGVWSAAEMKLLKDAQKELGNKWSEIAKRIPGRSENSVKNRWYNQKTSDKRAKKKKEEQAKRLSRDSDDGAAGQEDAGPMLKMSPQQLERDDALYQPDEFKPPAADLDSFERVEDV